LKLLSIFSPEAGNESDGSAPVETRNFLARLDSWLAVCTNPACPRRKTLLPRPRRRAHGFCAEDHWFCSPGCAHEFLLYRVRALLSQFRHAEPRAFRVPIGMVLVNRGVVSRQQVQEALRLQTEATSRRLGECLMSMRLVTERQIAAALSQQWACPFYPLESQPLEFLPFSIAPLELFRASSSVPAYLSPDSQSLHIAFSSRIDHTALYALESMLGCHTFPSIATSSAVQGALDFQSAAFPRKDPFFETVRDPRDVSAILVSYAAQFRASQLRLVRTQHHLWARFFMKRVVRDVLFQMPVPTVSPGKPLSATKDFSASADTRGEVVSARPIEA